MTQPWALLAGEFQRVIDTLPLAILLTDSERRIVAANPAALELFVYDLATLIGATIESLIPARYGQHHPEQYARYVHDPTTRTMGKGRDLWALKSTGEEIPVEVGLTALQCEPRIFLASIVDLTLRKEAETILRNRQALLESALEDARRLLGEQVASSTRLEERQKLGRELHDTLSQSLYSIGLGLRTAMTRADRGADAKEPLEYCLGLTESAMVEMRTLLFKLRPNSLEDVPLADVLRTHALAVGSRTPFQVVFEHSKAACEEPEFDQKYALYRIATEALHNCTKHALEASVVKVVLVSELEQVILSVQDDGPGFDLQRASSGHGMQTMKEWAESAHGSIEMFSGEKGTIVRAKVPRLAPTSSN